jgi:hypothetical protein
MCPEDTAYLEYRRGISFHGRITGCSRAAVFAGWRQRGEVAARLRQCNEYPPRGLPGFDEFVCRGDPPEREGFGTGDGQR